jgi:hypothetical protein
VIFVQPVTGFHVASVHSIALCSAIQVTDLYYKWLPAKPISEPIESQFGPNWNPPSLQQPIVDAHIFDGGILPEQWNQV